MGNETSTPNQSNLPDASKRKPPVNKPQTTNTQNIPYTTASISKPAKNAALNNLPSLNLTKQKILQKINNLKVPGVNIPTDSQDTSVSEIYYVNNAEDVLQYQQSQVSDLDRCKARIDATPEIPLLIPGSADTSKSFKEATINKLFKKTIQNVLNVAEINVPASPHIEEMSPKVLADIFADFQTKGMQAYRILLARQHQIVQKVRKESLQIQPVSNAKMKQSAIWFKDFNILKQDLRRANADLQRTMTMISELGHLLPANVRDSVDSPLFAAFNDATMPGIVNEANERFESMRPLKKVEETTGQPAEETAPVENSLAEGVE